MTQGLRNSIIVAVVVGITLVALYYREEKKEPLEDRFSEPTVTLILGETPFIFEVVATNEARKRGLSGREDLKDDSGMLFVFSTSALYGFWMKDMRFSIDIAWLDENLCILYLAPNVAPSTFPKTFAPPVPARYVIEVEEGVLGSHNLKIGSCLSEK